MEPTKAMNRNGEYTGGVAEVLHGRCKSCSYPSLFLIDFLEMLMGRTIKKSDWNSLVEDGRPNADTKLSHLKQFDKAAPRA